MLHWNRAGWDAPQQGGAGGYESADEEFKLRWEDQRHHLKPDQSQLYGTREQMVVEWMH